MPPAAPLRRFPTTAWSCVRAAQDPNHPQFVIAMDRLIKTYWKPAFHFLRAAGHPTQQAEDLTDEFFSTYLAKGWLRPADPNRGKFRNFLATVLKRFAYDQTVRATKQTLFERRFVSVHSLITDDDRGYEPAASETPEEAFQKQWRAEVLTAVKRNLRAYYEGLGDPKELQRFEIFAAYYFLDRKSDQPTQQELKARFLVSEDEVYTALKNVKVRYEYSLRQELRDQLSSEAEVDEEIHGLA